MSSAISIEHRSPGHSIAEPLGLRSCTTQSVRRLCDGIPMGVRHNRREEGAEWNGVIETKQQPGYVKIDDRERERERQMDLHCLICSS